MTLIILLILVAAALLIYLEYFYQDPDKLDGPGKPVSSKRKRKNYK